jgi:hypothetical protein
VEETIQKKIRLKKQMLEKNMEKFEYFKEFLNNSQVLMLPMEKIFEFLHKYSALIINLLTNCHSDVEISKDILRESIFNLLSLFDFNIEKFEEIINLFAKNIISKKNILNSIQEATEEFECSIYTEYNPNEIKQICESCLKNFDLNKNIKDLDFYECNELDIKEYKKKSMKVSQNTSFLSESK